MNVCFYTKSVLSVSNLLNISYLIHQRPNHNYSFLQVGSPVVSLSFMQRLREIYAHARFDDGRYEYHRDLIAFDKEIKRHVQPVKLNAFESATVGKVNDEASERFLEQMKPDILIQAGAGVLKQNIFSRAGATINLHHGLAPEIRGIDSTFWCMFYGIRDKIGVTCHFIDEHLDTGAVIVQSALTKNKGTFIDVQTENYLMGRDVLLRGVDVLQQGNTTIINKGQVKSYYFGVPDNFLYYSLKKMNFNPIMKISQKAYKMKDANFLLIPD